MSSYIQQADVESRLRDNFAALYKLPSQRDDLSMDIDRAESIVNGYLAAKYTVPVTASGSMAFVQSLCLDLFEELAWGRSIGDEIPKKVAERAKTAREQLKSISDGTIALVGAIPLTAPPGASGGSVAAVEGNDAEFTREKMTGF